MKIGYVCKVAKEKTRMAKIRDLNAEGHGF